MHFVLKKTDVFVNLPTGFGKSLIYQALPLLFDILSNASGHRCCDLAIGKSYEKPGRKAYQSWNFTSHSQRHR